MRRKLRCTQIEISRAVKGAVAAGVPVTRVELEPDGKIVLFISEPILTQPKDDYAAWKGQRNVHYA